MPYPSRLLAKMIISVAFSVLAACALPARPGGGGAPAPEIEDVLRLPQNLDGYLAAAGKRLAILPPCEERLHADFRVQYFRPWTEREPLLDVEETKDDMLGIGSEIWYGENRREVEPGFLEKIIHSCALESFPSRNEPAIAVAPGHLRGLPTSLPLFEKRNDFPFDNLAYPQMKLNEPLRVLHTTRDGVWLFVETPYSNGWVEARDVALVDRSVIDTWTKGELLVVVRDFLKVSDGRGSAYRAKIGTLLPLLRKKGEGWEVAVASADDRRQAVLTGSVLPGDAAAPFPLPFDTSHLALLGNQLAGQPYGWGELYGLRDCSAMVRDLFLPFGFWLPRTSQDQIESLPTVELSAVAVPERERLLRERGVPFLTLLFKPGHIMLYVGTDPSGHPLVFHSAWSVHLQDGAEGRVRYVGKAVVTTMEPGKELGLMPGSSLLEKITSMGTITGRCDTPSGR